MKKLTALFLVVVLLVSVFHLTVTAESVLAADLGDVDGDSEITEFDYILVKRAYFKTYTLTEDEEDAADVDRDGAVNEFDYLLIKRHYFGTFVIGSALPFEGTLSAEVIESMSFKDILSASEFSTSQEAQQYIVFEDEKVSLPHIKVFLIDSYEKYSSVKQYFTEEPSISKEFFTENLLVSTAITVGGSSYHYDFVSAVAENGKIVLNFAQCDPYYGSDTAYFEHLITVALKKSEAKGYDTFDVSETPVFHILDKDPTEFYVTEPSKILSIEDSQILATFLGNIEWTECDLNTLPKYDYDHHFVRDSLYHYHIESGTLYDEHRSVLAILSDEEKAILEGFLGIAE